MRDNDIYLLFSCDEWKTFASMSLVVATSNPLKFKEVLSDEIARKNMKVDDKKVLTLPIEGIDAQLTYGYINIVADGEVQ